MSERRNTKWNSKPERFVYTVNVQVFNLPYDPNKPGPNFKEVIDIFDNLELANAAARQSALFGTYRNRFRPSKVEIEKGERVTYKLKRDLDYRVEGRAQLSQAERQFHPVTGCLTYVTIVKDSPAVRGFPAVKSRKVIAQVKQRYFMDKSKPMTAAVAANEYRFLPKSLSVRGYFERITQEKEGPPPATISASTDLLAPWPQEMPPSFSEFSSTLVSHASNFSTPALERDGFDEPFSPHYPHNGYSEVFTPNQVTISTSDTLYGQHNSSRKLQKLNLMDDEIEVGSYTSAGETGDLIDLNDFEIKELTRIRRSSTIQANNSEARSRNHEEEYTIDNREITSELHDSSQTIVKTKRSVTPAPILRANKKLDDLSQISDTDESDTRTRRNSGDSSVWYDSLETQDGVSIRALSRRSTISNGNFLYPINFPFNIFKNHQLRVRENLLEQDKDLEHAAHLASIQPETFGLGTFNGTRVCQFLHEIRIAEERSGLGPGPGLAKLVARCLVGNAELWFRGLSSSEQKKLLSSSDAFYDAIYQNFSYEIPKEMEQALAYKYNPNIHKSYKSYYYTKLLKLRQTMPDVSDDVQKDLMWEGLTSHGSEAAIASSGCSTLQEIKEEMFKYADMQLKEKGNAPSHRSTRMANERATRGRHLQLREI